MSQALLRSVTDMIVRCLDPDIVLLFGSVARNERRRESDLDLLVVARFREPRQLRGVEVKGLLAGYALPIDLQLLTPEEFETESAKPFSLADTIRRHGVRLYERSQTSFKAQQMKKAPGDTSPEAFSR